MNCDMGKMSVYIYWFFAYIMLIKYLNAFEIEFPNVNVKDSIISLSLPDSKLFKNVWFYIEVNTNCTGEFVQANKSSVDSKWNGEHDFKTQFKKNVSFRISTLVELNDDVANDKRILTKVRSYKMNDQGRVQNLLHCDEKHKTLEKCGKEQKLRTMCKPIETRLANGEQPKHLNQLIFDATFHNGYDLRKYWSHEARNLFISKSREFVAFSRNDKHTYINNGKLYITALKNNGTYEMIDGCTSILTPNSNIYNLECQVKQNSLFNKIAPVLSAKIITKKTFSFMYGRIEFRAKMARGDWAFPYILLQPADTYTEDYKASQIRLAYIRGNEDLYNTIQKIEVGSSALFGSVLNWENERPEELYSSKILKVGFNKDFHNYTVIWHEDRIIYKVDGEEYGTIKDKKALKNFQKQCYIVLGLTINGIQNFPNDDIPKQQKTFRNSDPEAPFTLWKNLKWNVSSLIFEYLRVYATHNEEN